MGKAMQNPGKQGESDTTEDISASRWLFFRDVLVFQAKLLLDGLRDLLLMPVSLVAALFGLVKEPADPGRLFGRVMEYGRRSDRWINLFGDPRHFRDGQAEVPGDPGVDELVGLLEQRLLEQYRKGGVAASAKDAIDRALDAVHKVSARQGAAGPGPVNEDPGPRHDR